jgi:hypothetical protein
MLFFNYDTNEICLLDIDTGIIETKYKINIYIQKYIIDKFGYISYWYYSNSNKNIYLLRKHIDWNDSSDNDARIYKINIEAFKFSEIYYSKNNFHDFCVTDDYLYLLSYVEPSNGKSNKENNYIVKYNLKNNSEELVYFNKSLPEDKQVYAHDFQILEDVIILNGWYERLEFKNLYQYDIPAETMYVLDENAVGFSIFEDKILYSKKDMEVDYSKGFASIKYNGKNLIIYDFKENIKINLPDTVNSVYLDALLVDKNIVIFSREHKTIRSLIDKFWIFPSNKKLKDYYISDISGGAHKKIFKSKDQIDIFGIIDKNNIDAKDE